MSLILHQRVLTPELMDTESYSAEDARRILSALERINVLLGGVRATLYHFERFSKRWSPSNPVRIVDWGTGGADLPRAIVRWARRKKFQVSVVGIDNNAVVADYARKACQDYPEIEIRDADLSSDLLNSSPPFDYALSSLTLHHLSDSQIVDLLRHSDQMVKRGIIMNDLKRSARAWAWIWSLSRIFGAHPIVQHDGPLSVRRAFTSQELRHYAQAAGLPYLKVHTHFGYRFTLAGEKKTF